MKNARYEIQSSSHSDARRALHLSPRGGLLQLVRGEGFTGGVWHCQIYLEIVVVIVSVITDILIKYSLGYFSLSVTFCSVSLVLLAATTGTAQEEELWLNGEKYWGDVAGDRALVWRDVEL